MNINFYLRYPKKKGRSAIYISVTYRKQRAIIYPGESIEVVNWVSKKGCHKPKSIAENTAIIKRLNDFDHIIRETHAELARTNSGVVPGIVLERAVCDKLFPPDVQKNDKPILITDFFQTLIDDSKNKVRKTKDNMIYNSNSVKPYKSTMEHFKKFAKKNKYYLTDINQNLIDDFTNYLNEPLTLNTSAKYLTVFKTLVSYAIKKKLISKDISKEIEFNIRKAVADDIYLTEDEIQAIMDIKHFPTKTFEIVRDLFVIGCNTGLRFEEYSVLEAARIQGGFLEIDPKKLEHKYNINTKLVIPVLPMFEDILRKYPNGLPQVPCNQVFNKNLKKIAKKIPSLNRDYEKKLIRDHKVDRKLLKKWQMVVTHTARRSFVTNMYLRGVPVPTIMAISGHRTDENFKKYNKADNRKHAEILKKIFDEGEKQKAELLKKKLEDDKKRENGEGV